MVSAHFMMVSPTRSISNARRKRDCPFSSHNSASEKDKKFKKMKREGKN